MCYNAEISIFMFAVGFLGSAYLWTKKLYAEASFYGCVSTMQIVEFAIHADGVTCNSLTNTTATALGTVLNHLEPVALYAGIKYSKKPLSKRSENIFKLYSLCAILYTLNCFYNQKCTIRGQTHLVWEWNAAPLHVPFYTLFLITVNTLCEGTRFPRLHTTLVNLSYAVSFVVYQAERTIGEMWCFAAVTGPIIYSFVA